MLVVDEEIYRRPPALLIGTVDKFAQMPWRGPVTSLFGRVGRRVPAARVPVADLDWDADSHQPGTDIRGEDRGLPALRPPDLIIQDELHLIAGPLGSMVGLYETAVDRLATWAVDDQEVRPKVIASTATVRQPASRRTSYSGVTSRCSRLRASTRRTPSGHGSPSRVTTRRAGATSGSARRGVSSRAC